MTRELIYQKVVTKPFVDYDEYMPIRKWCIAHFGPSVIKGVKERPWHGHVESYYELVPLQRVYRAAFYFRDRSAATMFALRWS